MKNLKLKLVLIMLVLWQFSFAQLTILSGVEYGSYHRFVEDINTVLKTGTADVVINQSTSGAADNYSRITDPDSPYKLAMMQSDYLYYMKAADVRNNTHLTENLLVVLPLASEEIHFVMLKKTGYTGLKSLRDKRVAIGNKGQGTYVTASIIKDRSEVYWSSRNFHFDKSLAELYYDNIDAFVIVGSAPIEKLDLNPVATVDELDLINLEDFNDWAKYYQPMIIPKETYKWLDTDINTFGVRCVLVVNKAKLNDNEAKELSKLVSGIKLNIDKLIAVGHPKWENADFNNWESSDWPMYH
jgi:TRAP transporter TAXI family solute receptor